MGVARSWIRGRVLLARGRCPACRSELPDECGVCLGYRGPFPVEAHTLARWSWRFRETERRPALAEATWQAVPGTASFGGRA
jgi:hypothetical protein